MRIERALLPARRLCFVEPGLLPPSLTRTQNKLRIMKKILFSAILFTLALVSCKNSSDDNSTGPDPQLSGSKWIVTYFWDKDKAETSNFSGYSFEFKSDGTFISNAPGGSSVTGTWKTHFDDSKDKLLIVVAGVKPIDDLSQDWVILEKTDTVMKLKDDNTSHLEEIHFKKI